MTLGKDLGVIRPNYAPFYRLEENADRLYKKTYFFNEILKIQFFQLIASQIQQKLLTSKSSRLWTFAVIGVFAWAKIRALKLLILRKDMSNNTFFTEKMEFYRKYIFLLI